MTFAGQTFGALTATERIFGHRYEKWFFRCQCGKEVARLLHNVMASKNPSCGCLIHKRARDITGQRFGRLVALRRAGSTRERQAKWECRCDCGKLTTVVLYSLARGRTQSCGCIIRTQGGLSKKDPSGRTYSSYLGMIRRCTDTSHPFYKDYGGRGICVYFDWLGEGGFINFLKEVGRRPPGMTLDRIENDGNYEPGNVRWATGSMQRMNQRRMQKNET